MRASLGRGRSTRWTSGGCAEHPADREAPSLVAVIGSAPRAETSVVGARAPLRSQCAGGTASSSARYRRHGSQPGQFYRLRTSKITAHRMRSRRQCVRTCPLATPAGAIGSTPGRPTGCPRHGKKDRAPRTRSRAKNTADRPRTAARKFGSCTRLLGDGWH